MPTVRIGCVKFLNTLPLIEGLGAWKDAQLVAAVPSKLCPMLLRGEVDIALASVIDAARHAPGVIASGSAAERGDSGGVGGGGGVTILDVGMIGSDGPTRTVRVYSRVPFERVRTLHADTDSHTSVVLAQIILHHRFGVRPPPTVMDFHARERVALGAPASPPFPPSPPSPLLPHVHSGANGAKIGAKAGASEPPECLLLIGDKVETDPPARSEGYVHELDLGEAWKELTGLPLVYAAWLCRAGEEESLAVRAACSMLERSRLHNRTRLDHIVAAHAPGRHWDTDHAREYLGSLLRYDLGERERESVERFVTLAHEMGLLGADPSSSRPVLRWARPRLSPGPEAAGVAN